MTRNGTAAGWTLAALALAWMCSSASVGFARARKRARAVPLSGPITIDGVLNEAVWRTAPRYGDFVERKPALRGVPQDKTWFAVAFDASHLYVAVHCHDRKPDEVRARTTARDTFAVFSDDAISVKLDVARDRRTTVGFVLNPAGARLDYRGINERHMRREFDTRWHGAASRHSTGWSAEFRLPWSSLGVDPKSPPASIGLNFSRDHSRRNATYDWALMPPPFTPISASLYGELTGLERLADLAVEASATTSKGEVDTPTDRSWNVVPWALGGWRHEAGDSAEGWGDGGADFNLRVGADTRLQLTLNTDFSQVNVDDQVVNLDRFSLFMPEKREFFLRDVEVFSFGRASESQLFHSRRIGLVEGNPIPILSGAKVVTKVADSVRLGLLNVVTRGQSGDGQDGAIPWSNHSVARGLWEASDGSNLGVMWTRRQSLSDPNDYNDVLGLDFAFRGAGTPWLATGFGLVGRTGAEAGASLQDVGGVSSGVNDSDQARRFGGGVEVQYRGLLWRPGVTYTGFERGFRADLGFFRRVGVHTLSTGLDFEPRFQRYGLEKLTVSSSLSRVIEAGSGDGLDTGAGVSAKLHWNSGFSLMARGHWSEVTVQSPFSVGRDTTIPDGVYAMRLLEVGGGTPWVRAFGVEGSITLRDYFGGSMTHLRGSLVARPGGYLRVEAGASLSHVRFSDSSRDFWAAVLNVRAAVGLTPDLNLDMFVGWNRLLGRVPLNARLRWTWTDNSDVFVVWQASFSDDDGSSLSQSIVAKWMWSLP